MTTTRDTNESVINPKKWTVPMTLVASVVGAAWILGAKTEGVETTLEKLEVAVTALTQAVTEDVVQRDDLRHVIMVLQEDNPDLVIADHLFDYLTH